MKEFLITNWQVILFAVVIPLAWSIVRLTPTEKDDKILKTIVGIINFLVPDRKKGGGKHNG